MPGTSSNTNAECLFFPFPPPLTPYLKGICKSLAAIQDLVELKEVRSAVYRLTPEGDEFANNGSSEARVFNSIPAEGVALSDFDTLPGIVEMG